MAWVELELDDQTFRLLSAKAKRDGLSIAEVLRKIATREVCRSDDPNGYLAMGRLGGDGSEALSRFQAAEQRDG